MNFIAFTILRLMLFMLYFLMGSPLLGGIYLLASFLDSHESLNGLKWILAFPAIAWFFGVGWMANDTASRVMFEKQSLYKSVDLSFYAARSHLSFLPIVGHWFIPSDRSNKDGKDES